jgi:hypothetical protein
LAGTSDDIAGRREAEIATGQQHAPAVRPADLPFSPIYPRNAATLVLRLPAAATPSIPADCRPASPLAAQDCPVGRRGSATAARPDPAERSGRHPFNATDLVARLDDRHLQQAVQRLGRDLRRRHGRHRHDRPTHPPLRDPLHQGNAGLNYRSVLVCEVSAADAELYRTPGHRRRSRRPRPSGGRAKSV